MRPPSTLLQLNAILVLFCAAAMLFTNEADGQQDTLGLGGFSVPAEKEEIDLPSGYELVNDKDKFDEYYEGAKVKPCNVDFDKDGNIEVFYDKWASTLGCTLDLLVNKMDQIEFVAKVEDKEESRCVTEEIRDNLLPFIFNEANNGLAALTGGPEYGGDDDCADKETCEDDYNKKCIRRTMFAIGWELESGLIKGHLRQVGEPIGDWNLDVAKMDVKIAVGDVPEDKPLVTIIFGKKSVEFPGRKNPVCNNPRKATPPPAIWKVNSGEFKDKYFVTFHFFPQTTGAAGGPKCKASFIFSKNYASILMMALPATTTEVTTIGSTEVTTTSLANTTRIGSTETGSTKTTRIGSTKTTRIGLTKTTKIKSTKTTMGTGSTAAPTANQTSSAPAPPPDPGTTKPKGGLPVAAHIGIAAGSIFLLIIAFFVIWCCCCRAKKEKKTDDNNGGVEIGAAGETMYVTSQKGDVAAAEVFDAGKDDDAGEADDDAGEAEEAPVGGEYETLDALTEL